MDTTALETRGVEIQYEDRWIGEASRSDLNTGRVRGMHIALTAGQWCNLVMRGSGEDYIGGCCGNASMIQSTVTGIFHDGGHIDADTLYRLGEEVRTHPDGFDEGGFFVDFDQKTFDEHCARWDDLDGWEKLGLCYRGVADRLVPFRSTVTPTVEDDPLEALVHSTHLLRFWTFLTTDGTDTTNGQRHANHALTVAKMLPGTRKLLALLESNFHTWSGYAIVRRPAPTDVCSNGFGLCLYDTIGHAEAVLAMWRKSEAEAVQKSATVDDFLVRAVRVTTTSGLEFLPPEGT